MDARIVGTYLLTPFVWGWTDQPPLFYQHRIRMVQNPRRCWKQAILIKLCWLQNSSVGDQLTGIANFHLAEYSSAQLLVQATLQKRYDTLPNISVTEFGRLTDLMRKILTREPGDRLPPIDITEYPCLTASIESMHKAAFIWSETADKSLFHWVR